MSPEQSAALINAQVACALIEMQGMVAENVTASKNHRGPGYYTPPYGREAFLALQEKYDIGWNVVTEVIRIHQP